ncbi:hypothetical protein F511_30099 [Dorcoceras hygrometricum]|uniref:Uncharacterized protein n=1 Tax=Dorcoceras hygrometricum TaxID=472368 RepID=A0A2Z7D3E9_9LAMI|nr:hypothetical protein F511_30099 [Dorcoceras hygrometricum]
MREKSYNAPELIQEDLRCFFGFRRREFELVGTSALVWGGEAIKRLTQAQRDAGNLRRRFDEAAQHYSELEKRLAEKEAARAEETRAAEALQAALETRGLRLEAERAALLSEKRTLEVERASMKAELDETKARAAEEAERMRDEVANTRALGKEFLQSSEFDRLCNKKSVAYFKSGFEGTMAQFRANGYPEEEHPAPFLDTNKALRDMPNDDEEAAEEEEEEEAEEDDDATPPELP